MTDDSASCSWSSSSWSSQNKSESPQEEGYTYEELLGKGGNGAVFRIKSKIEDIDYALKIVQGTNLSEVQALSKFKSKHIVGYQHAWQKYDECWNIPGLRFPLPKSEDFSTAKNFDYDLFDDDLFDKRENFLFIKMEYCPKTLREYLLEHRGMAEAERLRIFAQVLDGVKEIHAKNLIHVDLKPDNILLSKDDEVKICDFGLCTSASGDLHCAGTVPFKAPELTNDKAQIENKKAVDMYSLGVILYVICKPEAHCTELLDVKRCIAKAEFKAHFPRESEIIAQLCADNPSKRPTAGKLLAQIQDKTAEFKALAIDILETDKQTLSAELFMQDYLQEIISNSLNSSTRQIESYLSKIFVKHLATKVDFPLCLPASSRESNSSEAQLICSNMTVLSQQTNPTQALARIFSCYKNESPIRLYSFPVCYHFDRQKQKKEQFALFGIIESRELGMKTQPINFESVYTALEIFKCLPNDKIFLKINSFRLLEKIIEHFKLSYKKVLSTLESTKTMKQLFDKLNSDESNNKENVRLFEKFLLSYQELERKNTENCSLFEKQLKTVLSLIGKHHTTAALTNFKKLIRLTYGKLILRIQQQNVSLDLRFLFMPNFCSSFIFGVFFEQNDSPLVVGGRFDNLLSKNNIGIGWHSNVAAITELLAPEVSRTALLLQEGEKPSLFSTNEKGIEECVSYWEQEKPATFENNKGMRKGKGSPMNTKKRSSWRSSSSDK